MEYMVHILKLRYSIEVFNWWHTIGFILAHIVVYFGRPQPRILNHYFLAWLAILTASPKCGMLEFWLIWVVLADLLSISYACLDTWQKGLLHSLPAEGVSSLAILNIAHILQDWCPAYQLNFVIGSQVHGDFVDHLYHLMFYAVTVVALRDAYLQHFWNL